MYARPIHRTAWAPIARSGLDQVHCKPLSAPPSSGISETSTSRTWGGLRAALRQAAYRRSIARTASDWAAALWQSRTWRASRVRSPPHGGPLFLGCEKHPETAGTLDRLARVVNITTLKDGYAVLLAVVAWSAAPGHGAGAKATAAGSRAVARRGTFGTQTIGFLRLAILRPQKGGDVMIPTRICHQGLSR
jgi:hypothetical protein